MKNNTLKIYSQVCLLFCFIFFTTCKKYEKVMFVSTGEVTNVSVSFAEAPGEIIDMGDGANQYGHCYSKTSNVTINEIKTQLGQPTKIGSFTSQITGLQAGTKYYIKAYLSSGSKTVYGEEKSFTTVAASLPTLTTKEITSITSVSASSGGNISIDGGALVTARGVCWSTSVNPAIINNKTTDGTGSGDFTSNLIGLSASTTYYVRAYATNSTGIAYGSQLIFTTSVAAPIVPSLTTAIITAVTTTTASSGGNITSDGGALINARGVCWNTVANPTLDNNKTGDGTGLGSFTSSITGLSANTTYYVRAYATNSAGTAYGSQQSFTTTILLPSVTTTIAGSITSTSATSGGNVTSHGGSPVNVRGVCWNTVTNPTIINSKTIDGSGLGIFTSVLQGLTHGTTYYLRAYATNSAGTAYGDEINFKTSVDVPSVTTLVISLIRATTAHSGGNITDDGGGLVTDRGVCWSTSQNPTIANTKTDDGNGSGIYTSTLSGLTPNTSYYVRAYATNSSGTAYGNQQLFTTDPQFVTDGDGNLYNLVYIGSQLWLKENLKTTRYNDFTLIPRVTDANAWSNLSTPAYCWYDNDSITYKSAYGALYNFFAVNTDKICPVGWHVPSDADWTALTDYAGGAAVAGGKLKVTGTTYWDSPNTGATNEIGFSAIGAGDRDTYGTFHQKGVWGVWFTSTEYSPYAYYRMIFNNYTNVDRQYSMKTVGLSIRCLRNY